MDTIFQNGFTADSIDAYGDVITGSTRVYAGCDVVGQITCRRCHTTQDGKTWSGRRLKKDVADISPETAEKLLKGLKPYKYRFKDDNRLSCGFMAQDLRKLQEGLGKDFGIVKEDKTLSVSYISLLPFLASNIQRQKRRLDELSGI